MRRISAILLLVAFSLPLIAAAFQDAESNQPACCRRAGIHHCSSMGQAESDSTSGSKLKSGACPLFPTTASVSALAKLALPGVSRSILAPALSLSAAPLGGHVRISASADTANLKRGPPSLLS